MSSSKLPVWLIATMMLLSMVFVLYPQSSANAATYCAQLRGATPAGHPDCSFSTLDKCRARVRWPCAGPPGSSIMEEASENP